MSVYEDLLDCKKKMVFGLYQEVIICSVYFICFRCIITGMLATYYKFRYGWGRGDVRKELLILIWNV